MKVSLFLLSKTVLLMLGMGSSVWAHGVEMTYQSKSVIEVQARYSSGNPMVNAQVSVYSPTDPTTAWQTGITDAQGLFSFTPGPDQPGLWEVTIRQAGHGSVMSIPIQNLIPAEDPSDPVQHSTSWKAPLEKGVLAASILWGCVGTALFFSRSKSIS